MEIQLIDTEVTNFRILHLLRVKHTGARRLEPLGEIKGVILVQLLVGHIAQKSKLKYYRLTSQQKKKAISLKPEKNVSGRRNIMP